MWKHGLLTSDAREADASLYEVLRGHLRQVLLETHQPLNSILRGALRLIHEHRRGKARCDQQVCGGGGSARLCRSVYSDLWQR